LGLITNRLQFQAFVDRAKALDGAVDVLVNNAGGMPLSRLDEMKINEWDQMVDVHFKGVLYGIATVLPGMTARKSATSSTSLRSRPTAAVRPPPFTVPQNPRCGP
jgi:NADP-dependent 3-hydroxy acid dehydrogenase YdfG